MLGLPSFSAEKQSKEPKKSHCPIFGANSSEEQKKRFSRRSEGRMVIIYRDMIYAKILYGVMVLFSGGMASPVSPINSSTAYTLSFLQWYL